ncbi:MAG: DUF5719 family protein [Cellulomonadaceae bacterium]|jgi:hypothetical protein|nr:DUF5719 family protein [Cellulomonadaceae bacterium]
MASRRSVTRFIAQGITAVVAVGTVAALTAFGPIALESAGLDSASGTTTDVRVVEPQPAPVVVACPPGVKLPEGADVGDSAFAAGSDHTTTVTVSGVAGHTLAGTAIVEYQPEAHEAPLLGGVTSSVTPTGDLRGLAAGSCSLPSTEQWLVAGNTEPGNTALLTVTNPSSGAATVTLRAFGGAGPLALGSGGVMVVGPGESSQVRLEAIAPGERRLAVSVQSEGARVDASMQVQMRESLVPRGTDTVESSVLARSVVVTGIVSTGHAIEDPAAPALRLLNPGDDATEATLRVFGPAGEVTLRGLETVALEPGVVTDVLLGGLEAGRFSVLAESDAPLAAAGMYQRTGEPAKDAVVTGKPVDVSWIAGQAWPVTPGQGSSQRNNVGSSVVTLPPGTAATVNLVNLGGLIPVTASLTGYDAHGAVLGVYAVDVAARSTASVAVSEMFPDGNVAMLVLAGDDQATADQAANDQSTGDLATPDQAANDQSTGDLAIPDQPATSPALAWNVGLTASDDSEAKNTLITTVTPVREPENTSVVRVEPVVAR